MPQNPVVNGNNMVSIHMTDLKKLADQFAQKANEDIFGALSYGAEGKDLAMLAGKLHYKAKNERDPRKSERLLQIARLVLEAGDALKRL
jgi:hypothetical protein